MARPLLIFTPLSLLLLLLLLLPFSSSEPIPIPATLSSSPLALSAHTVLTTHGFPIGLLPTNVHTYSLNHTSGDFSVHLHETCRLLLPPDNYLATYSKLITGRIVENRIADLNGIKVRAFFRWWGITGIKSSGDNLVFEVGSVTAKYPAKNFDETPDCEGKHSSS